MVGHKVQALLRLVTLPTVLLFSAALIGCGSSPGASETPLALLNDFRQELVVPALPAKMTPQQRYRLSAVTIKNTGQQVWAASGEHQVEFTYNWLTPDRKLVSHGVVTPLLDDLAAGQSQSLVATIVAPLETGPYLIRFTMIAQKIAWFSDMGGATVEYPVTVVPQ
jgi:hypothetical protein